jgi:glycosyltransferase involved in cell wall biosynthesis
MRYAWEPEFDPRFHRFPRFLQPAIRRYLQHLKKWDGRTASRPDFYIANSSTSQERVRKYYKREAEVLYPPVETKNFFTAAEKSEFYLGAGRFVVYKKFDLLVETFLHMPDKKLVLIGDGPEKKRLEFLARGAKNITFLGAVEDRVLFEKFAAAKAFILPQKEDAGIVQLEALASGTPVLAYRAGGALDVISENENGLFFEDQTPKSLITALEKFESKKWDAQKIQATARKFDTSVFQENFCSLVQRFYAQKFS